MDIKYNFKKPTRVIESTIDTNMAAHIADCENGFTMPNDIECPIYYVVKVQVKILFLWITIWEKYCDISDGDTRQYIISEASKLKKIMEG